MKSPSAGNGSLGMGIAKKLIDLMNGTIKVESQLGKGTRFTFKIPSKIS